MATRKPAVPNPQSNNQRPTNTPMPRGADPAGQATSIERERKSVDREQIAKRAYERYLQRNREHGRDQEDWLEAERELRNRK